tara:strand:+ start:434 stop:814 length:381 start_codon:yes stop_codon:yes gene_type:complete
MARVDSGPPILRSKKFTYDYAVDGGAISTIVIGAIPDNAVVTRHFIDVYTAAGTASGTAALSLQIGSTVIKAANHNAAPFTGTGTSPVEISKLYKTTSTDNVTLGIATAALNAGAFNYYVQYYQSV